MAASASLNAALESAGGSSSSSQVVNPAPESGAPAGGQVEGGAPAEPSFIGFTPDDPNAGAGGPQEPNPGSATIRLAENLPADTVVCFDGDKPVTAQELLGGHLRQSDYTKKTQELATQRDANKLAIDFFEANRPTLERLYHGDVNEKAAVLREIAKNFGVDLGTGQQRGADGRFAAGQPNSQEEELYDLEKITDPSEKAFAERHNAVVLQNRALAAQVNDLNSKFGQFQSQLTTAQQQQQIGAEIQSIAQKWGEAGLKDVDVAGAMQLVGKPMTAEQAIHWVNMKALLSHTYKVAEHRLKTAGSTPNEPGSVASGDRSSLAGKSLSQALQDAAANRR